MSSNATTHRFAEFKKGIRISHARLPKALRTFKNSLREYRSHWKTIIGLLTIVSLPVAILSSSSAGSQTSDTALSAYLAFAQIIMNVALVYAVCKITNRKEVTVREAYYDGSAMIVRVLLVSLLIILSLIPLIVGIGIFNLGLIGAAGQLALGEQLLVGILALIFIIPGISLIVRNVFAVFVVFDTKQGPLEALRTARERSRGHVIALLRRLLLYVVLVVLTLLIPVVILITLTYVTQSAVFQIALQYFLTITLLPVTAFYMYSMYQKLPHE